MIVSLNWLKKYADVDMPIDQLSTLIGARLVEIEEVIDLGAKYNGILIAKVIEAGKLEGSDHLSVTKIDDGGIVEDIERDENGLIQVVCGAPNIKAGQTVVWLPPKTIVPSSCGTPEPFVLDTRNIRGVTSNGMIASARELDLFDEHSGILELDTDLPPGTSFAKAYELDDYLLDIENKSLTHRPDCFGVIGFAREVSAIAGKKFKSPDWFAELCPDIKADNQMEIKAAILDPELSDRYQAIVMSGIDANKQSPLQIQTYLARVGVRPINAVVDATNYLMMLTGQPLHAFDYDKFINISGGKNEINVRAGRDGEKLELLDGRTIELTVEDIVISAGDNAVALAGAMGGKSTDIDENTKNIIIESATFNLFKLRATQMRHGIFSEAITRFTKGQPAELTAPVLAEAIHLISGWTDAKVASPLSDVFPNSSEGQRIVVPLKRVNDTLGSGFDIQQIALPLTNTEFSVDTASQSAIIVLAPWWRADIHIPEDVIEEIGRLSGFDNIKPKMPIRDFTAVKPTEFDSFRSLVREILVRAGANEVLTYSFIHGDILKKAGQDAGNSYRVVNSISPDLQYYRQSLTPSLLGLVHPNIKQGYDNFALFEINKVHTKQDGLNDEGVPIETDRLALVVANKNKLAGAPFYRAKRIFEYLCMALGLSPGYRQLENGSSDPVDTPFEYRRSAQTADSISGKTIGTVGEYKTSVIRNFKLTEYSAGFEIDMRILFDAYRSADSKYKPLSRYPGSERDICFQVNRDISYRQIIDASKAVLDNVDYETVISPVDIYQPKTGDTKNITIRIRITSASHTLTGEEVTGVIDSVIKSVVSETKATVT